MKHSIRALEDFRPYYLKPQGFRPVDVTSERLGTQLIPFVTASWLLQLEGGIADIQLATDYPGQTLSPKTKASPVSELIWLFGRSQKARKLRAL